MKIKPQQAGAFDTATGDAPDNNGDEKIKDQAYTDVDHDDDDGEDEVTIMTITKTK